MSEKTGMVDSHVHLLPERLARKIRAYFDAHISKDHILAYPLDQEALLAALYDLGIDTVWTLPYTHKAEIAAGLNEASAAIVARHANAPVEVIGGATVHPHDSDPAAIVREALDRYGLRVLKLHCSVGNFEADDPALDPVWALVAARRMPVVVHIGHATSGQTAAAELLPLERVALRHPEARIIIAHCGHPAGPQALDLVEKYPTIYADLTPVVTEPVALPTERVHQLSHKLLFGSDAPNTVLTVEEALAHVKSFGLNAQAEAGILGGNARRLISEVL